MFGSLGMPELMLVVVLVAGIVWPATRICAKAGFSPWIGLAAAIPGANILLLWFLALAAWPRKVPQG